MKIRLNKITPHLAAIAVFVLASLLFCKPVLEGNVLQQHDIIGWKGAAQESFEVKAKTGHMPLWNTHVFSGMPNYQIALEGKQSPLPNLQKVFGLWLPNPANFFFIACITFYILALALGLNPLTGILGGLAFAFSTYNPVIISAGHETKMYAIAFMPLLLAGLILIFNKKYWVGLAVATLGAHMELTANHPQINYYFFIVAAFISLFYAIEWIRQKDFKHIFITLSLVVVAALAGLGTYYLAYSTTKEYAAFTMRGGKTVEIQGNQVKAVNTKGLDDDYALSYSMKIAEPLVMLMPNAFGSSSSQVIGENSKVIEKLVQRGIPETGAAQLATLPAYWGGMIKASEVGTSGPPYVGAIICLLALIGFVCVSHPLRWGLLAATVLAIFMSWGSYFPSFNLFLLHHLPLYNKFRAPSMILVIPQLTLVIMAAITVQKIFFSKDGREFLQQNFKKISLATGGLIVFIGLVFLGQSYTPGLAEHVLQANNFDKTNAEIYPTIVAGLKADRQSLFGAQLLRTILFALVVLGILWLYLKNRLKPAVATGILGLILLVDLWVVDKKYLTDEFYVPKEEAKGNAFIKSPVDEKILQDKDPHFRVFDVTNGFTDNRASYFHRSALGYHAAKLRVYQDVIERYFTPVPNEQILNALDVKYFVNLNSQGQPDVVQNQHAYGAVWFVKGMKPAKNDVDALQEIGQTNLRDTTVVAAADVPKLTVGAADSSSTIQLVNYGNDRIEYKSASGTPQFAVFSEVYYPAGWKASIDGKPTEIIRTNYFMRGLSVPAGNHTITFVFDPDSVRKGNTISYLSGWLVIILVLGGFAMEYWTTRKKQNPPAS